MNTFESIDEKLAEIKALVVLPDCNDLLTNFEWSRKWFASIEEVLLSLAYRGDSDKHIIEFIKAKIINTDVLTFNDILRDVFSAAPIRNHYQIMLDDCVNKWKKDPEILMLNNRNTKIVDYVLKNRIKSLDNVAPYLSVCESNIAVDYLIANPDKINWDDFPLNNNVKAIKYCISLGICDIDDISATGDDDIADYIVENASQQNIRYSSLCANTNDKVIDFILKYPNDICYHSLSLNTNDKAVDYLLANPSKIEYYRFLRNSNDKAVNHLLANPDKIVLDYFLDNENDKAVDYIFANIDIVPSFELHNIFWNDNDRIIEYILDNMKYDTYLLNRNACSYKTQKLAKFNELQLFPRIPHLVL